MDIKLATKIFNVMKDAEHLKKDMDVGGKYKAVSEFNVLSTVKDLLVREKLILVPIDAEVEQIDKMTQIKARYKLIDVETGEFEILSTVGNGADTQDKGSGKAWTYAYKALLQKTFCLFSGEDTDNTHSDNIKEHDIKSMGIKEVAALEISFGKHKGEPIGQVYKTDHSYLEWLYEQPKTKQWIKEAIDALSEADKKSKEKNNG